MNDPKTVADFIEFLSAFPPGWPVKVSTGAGGGIAVVQRDIGGVPTVAIFGKNGGSFGDEPFTEEEYQRESGRFLADLASGRRYTSIHGDHRTYSPSLGDQATCFGRHYDRLVIERMVRDGLIMEQSVDVGRVAYLDGVRA